MQIYQKELHKALVTLCRVAKPKGSAIASSDCVRIRRVKACLELTAVDYDMVLSTAMIASSTHLASSGDTFDLLVSAKALREAVNPPPRTPRGTTIDMSVDGSIMSIGRGTGTVKIVGLPFGEDSKHRFPEPSDLAPFATFDSAAFLSAIEYASPAIMQDETRQHLYALALLTEGKAIGCDGHRLHIAEFPSTMPENMYIKPAVAGMLRRIIDTEHPNVYIRRAEKDDKIKIVIQSGNWQIYTKDAQCDYPPWYQVIPKQYDRGFDVVSDALTAAMKRFDNGTRCGVEWRINGAIQLKQNDLSSGTDKMSEVGYYNSFGEFNPETRYGFNPRYVLDAISCGGEVRIELNGPLDPIKVTAPGRIAVVMPMRV